MSTKTSSRSKTGTAKSQIDFDKLTLVREDLSYNVTQRKKMQSIILEDSPNESGVNQKVKVKKVLEYDESTNLYGEDFKAFLKKDPEALLTYAYAIKDITPAQLEVALAKVNQTYQY